MEDCFPLPDGRRLGYALYGPEDGRPVLYLHGTPSSRREPELLAAYGVDLDGLLRRERLRLIATDRPGMGLSTYNRHSTFVSVAEDAAALLTHLGYDQCSVLCWSGGGPYALAFAGRFPERTKQVTILCGFTRRFDAEVMAAMTLNKWYFRAARYVPFLLRWALRQMRNRTFRSMLPRWLTGLPRSDYKLIAQIPALNGLVRATVRESVRLETRGAVHEARLYFGVLPFALSAIRVPVRYWWGTEDNTVIHLHAAAAEQEIPGAAVRYRAGEGHLSLYVHCMAEALRELSGPPERSGTGNAWPEN